MWTSIISRTGTVARLALYAAIAIALVTPIRLFIAQPFIVSGTSMMPSYKPRDYLVVDEWSYRSRGPSRGEAIIFRYPLDPALVFIKRVIALPGESVKIEGDHVTVSGTDGGLRVAIDMPLHGGERAKSMMTLHDDEYFVLGDNGGESADSRTWGPLRRDFIIGRAVARLFPIARISFTLDMVERDATSSSSR